MALLNSLVNSSKPKDKGTSFSVVMIHYSKLVPSENNNYSVDHINELANMILLSGGIKQNLLARKKSPDEYELIAGHRRRLAVKRLVEELGHPEFAMVPVHVEKEGDLLSEVNLILTNCGARERSDWEKMMEVARLTELMKAMQTGSEEEQEHFRQLFGKEPGLGGRELRKAVAETLGLSETKVANLSHINSKLAPELKEKFREGEIGVSVANEAAGLPPEEQQKLAEKPEIKLTDVKKKSVSESDTAAVEKNEEIPGQMSVADYPGAVPNGAEDAAVTQQKEEYSESEANKKKLDEQKETEETAAAGQKPEDNVINAEPTEIEDPSSDKLKPVRAVLQKESAELDAWLKAFEGEPSERIPPAIEHKKIIVAALAAMVCSLEETELQKQMQWPRAEQPELPAMRNNDQRKEFLDTFREWPVWFRVPEASEVYYRYDLPDQTSLAICEYHYYAAWMEEYKNRYSDMNPEQIETREYLLTPGYHYLRDCRTNRSTMIEKLKEIQKKG